MIEINHTYTLTSAWQRQLVEKLVDQLKAIKINEKLILMPENIAEGGLYYTGIVAGLSVLIWDITFKVPILIRRLKSEDELYIIHYDFSDEMNLIYIENIEHKIGYMANLGLGVFDNSIDNVFEPVVGKRVYAMRLLVAKNLLNFPLTTGGLKRVYNQKSKKDKEILFFYDHIDSESKLIMNEVKNKTFADPAFEIYLRGIALRLFANFIDRYSNLALMQRSILDSEVKALNETKEYLLNNLFNQFPGVLFLANRSVMSVTKFKSLFKKNYADTPNNFFSKKKMFLAKELLKSGKFDTVNDVSKELNYKTLRYFSLKYFKQFGKKPEDDFNVSKE